MRPARLLVRRAAAIFVAVGLGSAALAAGVKWLHIEDVERELEAQFADLHASGALDEPRIQEDLELQAARADLARVLQGVKQDDRLMPAFGAPGVLSQTDSREELDRLEAGLRERAHWLAALERLPDRLWESAGEPPAPEGLERSEGYVRRPSDGLAELRALTNLISAKAFVVGQDPDRAGEAGRWLGRGLALVRATDSGSCIDLLIRVPMEQVLLSCGEALCRMEGQDVDSIRAGMRAEFERHAEADRLVRAVRSDLRWQEYVFQDNRALPSVPGGNRAVAQSTCLAKVVEWRALLGADLDAELGRLAAAAEDRELSSFRRMDYIVFQIWKLRLDRRNTFLAGGWPKS
jgi:hypothetical protein